MGNHYTSERNVQIVIALMKAHGIKRVIVSPGTTNLTFVGSIQNDPFFTLYSSADERSAAYMACGLAAETQEPVALSCTGATASRNYIPGLTEAYYRKLPILAITSTQHLGKVGNLYPQVIDRSVVPNDIVRCSVSVTDVHCKEDEWACTSAVNRAMLALRANGGGPVHINLTTTYSEDFSVKEMAPVRSVRRYEYWDELPCIPNVKCAVVAGAHAPWSPDLTTAVEVFCEVHDAVVIDEPIGNYRGRYKVPGALLGFQDFSVISDYKPGLVILLGEMPEDYGKLEFIRGAKVWRVSEDGDPVDPLNGLVALFAMREIDFFGHYDKDPPRLGSYCNSLKSMLSSLRMALPEFPFSNIWVALKAAPKLPVNSVLHLGILNTARAWSFAEIPSSVRVYSNSGGFGIDGNVSSLIGASLANPNQLYFGAVGDLSFFYDMNSLGNRHVGRNVRLLVVNNNGGQEFRNVMHPAERVFGRDADAYMAAVGHYGGAEGTLIKCYCEGLGFDYVSARTKDEFLAQYEDFFSSKPKDRPVIFEVFTNSRDESDAVEMIRKLATSTTVVIKNVVKTAAKCLAGDAGLGFLKKCKATVMPK